MRLEELDLNLIRRALKIMQQVDPYIEIAVPGYVEHLLADLQDYKSGDLIDDTDASDPLPCPCVWCGGK